MNDQQNPGRREPRKIDFRGAIAHCAPEPSAAVVEDIRAAARRSGDSRAYLEEMLEQARRAA
jgi:hypothetical protein